MNIFLNDINCRATLFPFALTRHVSDIRIGILTIREKWEHLINTLPGVTLLQEPTSDCIFIEANLIPTKKNVDALIQSAIKNEKIISTEEIKAILFPWHIFQLNEWAIQMDFELITQNRNPIDIDASNHYINAAQIFIEEGAKVVYSSLNASAGPIYIGKNAEIMEGSLLRGPLSIGENSVVKMGTKIYGGTTIGPNCIVGGEIKNAVIFEYSNKAHDGYLGDSVIGSWCNLGAGTTTSNVKNNAGEVSYQLTNDSTPIIAGNKGGLIMGDYSRSAINTSFNTGTLVGVCCNVFSAGFPKNYIENFSWGDRKYIFNNAIADIDRWKKFKNQTINENEIKVLKSLY